MICGQNGEREKDDLWPKWKEGERFVAKMERRERFMAKMESGRFVVKMERKRKIIYGQNGEREKDLWSKLKMDRKL